VELADNSSVPICGYGNISVVLPNGRIKVIHHALYVPDLEDTLASVCSIIGDSGDIVSFTKNNAYLTQSDTDEHIVIGRREGDLYYLYADILHTANSSTVEPHTSSLSNTLNRTYSARNVESNSMDSISDVTFHNAKTSDDILEYDENGNSSGMTQSSINTSSELLRDNLDTSEVSNNVSKLTVHKLGQLHQQFGHIHLRTIMRTADTLNIKLPKIDTNAIDLINHSIMKNCLICNKTKLTQTPIYSTLSPALRKIFRLFTDVVFLRYKGQRKIYWQIIVDEWSRFIIIYFLTRKSLATDTMIRHIADVENRNYPIHVAEIRSDTGELITKEFISWCNSKIPRIRIHPSPPSVKEFDGLSEKNVRTISDMSDAMMLQAGLPRTLQFVQFSILYAATVKNVTYHSFTKNVPYKAYLDKTYDMAIIHAFGTLVSLYISKEQRLSRHIREKSELGLFLGYKGEDFKIVIAYNFRSRSIGEYFHVTFHEGVFVGSNPNQQLLDG
jgi:hypothetical protein